MGHGIANGEDSPSPVKLKQVEAVSEVLAESKHGPVGRQVSGTVVIYSVVQQQQSIEGAGNVGDDSRCHQQRIVSRGATNPVHAIGTQRRYDECWRGE